MSLDSLVRAPIGKGVMMSRYKAQMSGMFEKFERILI